MESLCMTFTTRLRAGKTQRGVSAPEHANAQQTVPLVSVAFVCIRGGSGTAPLEVVPQAPCFEEIFAERFDAGFGHLVIGGGHQLGAQHLKKERWWVCEMCVCVCVCTRGRERERETVGVRHECKVQCERVRDCGWVRCAPVGV